MRRGGNRDSAIVSVRLDCIAVDEACQIAAIDNAGRCSDDDTVLSNDRSERYSEFDSVIFLLLILTSSLILLTPACVDYGKKKSQD